MTEYEIIDAIASYQSLFQAALMSYFTVMSAYMVVAFFVGKQLTRFQVLITTGLYLFMQLFLTWGVIVFLSASRILAESLNRPEWTPPSIEPVYLISPILALGILAGIKFMWDTRGS